MNQVYRYTGCSKQSFHQKMDRRMHEQEQQLLLLPIIEELRVEHPGVAARQLYWMVKPTHIGRDKFEDLCFKNGFKLKRSKAYKKTTDSHGVIRFPNLIAGREFTAINQAWSSDITYYQIGRSFYYLTFIIDLFSRTIVGYSVSRRLLTEQTTMAALIMAFKERDPAEGLIFHSDGGGQYYCKDFLKLTLKYKMRNSMCDVAYENPHAERINGTIKNQYLKGYNPQSFESLELMTSRAIQNYNWVRPHQSLKNMPPAEFERPLPAGGASLSNDNFCIDRTTGLQHMENSHLLKRSISKVRTVKPVDKTVNVF